MATLAKGGRTNTLGFGIRLIARIPFILIATRLYGAEALGRFASALVLIEVIALVCSLGEKRGLAQRLTEGGTEHGNPDGQPETNLVFDGLLLALVWSAPPACSCSPSPRQCFRAG